jgi:hypothetical protein
MKVNEGGPAVVGALRIPYHTLMHGNVTMSSNSNSLIVCETTGQWAAALRRELPQDVSLVETRSLSELFERLSQRPSAMVALELTAEKKEPTLAALVRIGREFPQAAPIVLADRTLTAWEDLAREAGAIHFVVSPRKLAEVGEIARQRITNLPECVTGAADNT